ncbi:MAG: glycosyltransferase family 2 protein [Thermomonas sp.]|uniref:glycosyltransferase family 2 protein n=1 Tax=Thermomonas sp. TaxID=1971895 RepID=UPI001ECFE722|nr:glycosyltransferase family 2 protein [Thermomonas sp.]MBV2209731.1 glycosyltransferase family 2 protein [Thermomonas sp.]
MKSAGIAAVVVTYASEETIDECLQRLRAAQEVAEIRVIDNNSQDETIEIVQRHAVADSRVRFVANPDNPGFAVACNQGAHASQAEWLAFINPDCFVEADTLSRLRTAAASLGSALVGGQLRGEDGALDAAARRRDPNFVAMLRSSAARDLSIPEDATQPLQRVDAISGALMLLPRPLFEAIKGFDEGYRLHAEDLDFCRRVRLAGSAVAVANTVEVLHVRGVSSRRRPLFVERHKHRGLWRYFRKFEAPQCSVIMRCAVFAMIWGRFPIAVLRAAMKG